MPRDDRRPPTKGAASRGPGAHRADAHPRAPARRRAGAHLRATAGPRVSRTRARSLQSRLLEWYAANARDLPWRRTTDPYAVLVSEVMLQQTQVGRVVVRFGEFLAAYSTFEALADADLADVLSHWRGLGYNNRAERLWRTARLLATAAGGRRPAELPTTLDGLRTLPGVGPYTARAVMVFAYNADLAAVDTNVRRVLTHELGLPTDLTPAELQAVADAVLPRGRSRDWHNALMDYGALVVTARATGLGPRSHQGRFEGSRRWYRSCLLQALLDDGPQAPEDLARRLGADPATVSETARALEADGLVRREEGRIAIAGHTTSPPPESSGWRA